MKRNLDGRILKTGIRVLLFVAAISAMAVAAVSQGKPPVPSCPRKMECCKACKETGHSTPYCTSVADNSCVTGTCSYYRRIFPERADPGSCEGLASTVAESFVDSPVTARPVSESDVNSSDQLLRKEGLRFEMISLAQIVIATGSDARRADVEDPCAWTRASGL